VFTERERDEVRDRLLDLARADPAVAGAAVTGSHATGAADQWSDIDLALGISGSLEAAISRWTQRLYSQFGAVHHWDRPAGPSVYRVFLLPDWLEADIGFMPADAFGASGPSWRLVFGQAASPASPTPPDKRTLAGLAWHHALHARICVERDRRWQAEYWIGAIRAELLALACLRRGYPSPHAKGAHLLAPSDTAALEATLVRSLDRAELKRALGAALVALAAEFELTDPDLARRLTPMLAELTSG
jgi:hypothetical protein